MIDAVPIVDEVIEYFRQEIFPDEAAVIMYKLKHCYEPKLAHSVYLNYTELVPGEQMAPEEFNCIHVPYNTIGELNHAQLLINSCWKFIFTLDGLPFYGGGLKAFIYRDVLFFRVSLRRIDSTLAENWREMLKWA